MLEIFTPTLTKTKRLAYVITALLVIFQVGFFQEAFAQTKGVIFEKSTASPPVLDKNGNGYVSSSATGFTGGNDMGTNSETTYRFFPQMPNPKGPEPLSDLSTGSGGGHTDLAQYPLAMFFDGSNVMFRVRLGGSSTASKGYSFLFDTDGVFNKVKLSNGTLVDYVTPSKVVNLGFEYEVVMAANFDIVVYKHTGSGDNNDLYSSNVIWRGSDQAGGYKQYFQKAVAASENGSDADYFYDFFVPLSAFGGGFDATTKLRMSGASVTSAQTGLEGTISDVGGVNDKAYGNDKIKIWKDVIAAFPPTSLNDLANGDFCVTAPPAAPAISTATVIRVGAANLTGTASTTDNGSTVRIYRNGAQIGTPASIVNGAWNFSLAGITLASGDILTASVYRAASGNCSAVESNSSTAVTIGGSQLGTCTTAAPVIPASNALSQGQKTLTLSWTIPLTAPVTGAGTLKVYRDGVLFPGTYTVSAPSNTATTTSYTYVFTPTIAGNCGNQFFSYTCGSNNISVNYATIAATITGASGCESKRSNPLYINGNSAESTTVTNANTTAAPVITNTFLCPSTKTLSGTAAANADIYLFVNDQPVTTSGGNLLFTTKATNAGAWSISLEQYAFVTTDVITVKAKGTGTNGVSPSASPALTMVATCSQTTAPAISAAPCASATTITGTLGGSEPTETVIYVYRQTVAGVSAPATDHQVNAYTTVTGGAWTATLRAGITLKAGDQLYAVAQAPSGTAKTLSNVSNVVLVTSPATAASLDLILNPIIEGAVSVSGTSDAAGTVNLYIDGQKIAETTTVTAGANVPWNIAITAANQKNLAAGVRVTASLTTGAAGCPECQQTAEVPVSCIAPDVKTVSGYSPTVCAGSANTFTLNSSQTGIIYTLKSAGTERSISVLGDGTNLTLTSDAITSTGTYIIEARKVGSGTCGATPTSSMAITANPMPVDKAISAPASVYAGTPALITVQASESGYYYQLINAATLAPVKTAVTGTGSDITLTTEPMHEETSFLIQVTDPTRSTYCTRQLTQTAKVGTTPLPVELLYFRGKAEPNAVVLDWATATEKNNDHFMVERSLDSRNFEGIGKVSGNLNSMRTQAYTFTDKQAPAAIVYYRLKQVDTDGTFTYSNIVAIDRSRTSKAEVALVYPNPTRSNCEVLLQSPETETASLMLFDALGKVINRKTVTLNAGRNVVPVQTKGLPAGMYFLKVSGKQMQADLKIQKLND